MSRLVSLAFVLAAGCIVIQAEPDDTDDPIVDPDPECDADRDGVRSPECGGLDCDDLDASVRPGADEVYGDEIDQDCDGMLDVRLDRVDGPSRTVPLDWGWSGDLRSVGGTTISPTGRLISQELVLADRFGGGVEGKWRSDYAEAGDVFAGVRVGAASGPLDVVAHDGALEVWQPRSPSGVLRWSDDDWLASDQLDAVVDGEGLWAVGCDAEGAVAIRVDLAAARTVGRHDLPGPTDACAILGGADGEPLVLVTAGQGTPLERWRLDVDGGFTDRLQLAARVDPQAIRTGGADGAAVLALLDDGDLLVFDRDGRGTVLGAGRASEAFDVAVAPSGDVLVAWVDVDGVAWSAVGALPGPLVSRSHTDVPGADAVAAGLLSGELAIAVQQGPSVVLLRARR